MKALLSLRRVLAAVAWFVCMSAFAWAQDSANPGGSLGDLARQTRAQHATGPEGNSSRAQDLVDEMQQEQEAAENAPIGFKNYDAGDYRLFVPYPFSIEGRENGGAVLLGSQLGVTNTEVMAGTPIPIPAGAKDIDLINLARQTANQHGPNPYCSASTQGSHKAIRCNWNGVPRLLGREVVGSEVFVVGSNSMVPVMCVTADDQHLCLAYNRAYGSYNCNNLHTSWEEVQRTQAAMIRRDADARTTWQACDHIIYPSIQLKEDIVVHPASIGEGKAPRAAATMTTGTVPGPVTAGQSDSQTASLAELARQTRQTPHGMAQATLDNAEGASTAPPGFQSFVLQYCQNPQQCSEVSVVIPEKAEVVSRINGQHIFKAMLDGDPVMLYAGPADVNAPYRSMTDPDYIRMRDLANSNGWSREKTDGVSTQELTIEGKSALMTRFRYQRDQKKWWIGERALI